MNTLDLLTTADRQRVLRKLGTDWTARLLDLEGGAFPLHHYVSEAVIIASVRPFVQPLLTDQNVLDLMAGLEAALKAENDYLLFGEWDPEHDQALAPRTPEERTALLQRDVNICVFRLMWATEPCITCTFERDSDEWKPQSNALSVRTGLCREHASADTEDFRKVNAERRLSVVQ